MASICCSPPDSSAPPLPLRSASRGKVWYTRATVQAPRAVARGQAQVLVHREGRPDAPALRHVPHPAVGDGVGGKAEDLLAGETDAARGRARAR